MPKTKRDLVTLKLVVTVPQEDAETCREALMEALNGDFEAVFSTKDCVPTAKEVKAFNKHFNEEIE